MATTLTMKDVFERAKAVEQIAETFYAKAAERFAGTEMQMLLIQLAEEESSHQDDVNDLMVKHSQDISLSQEVTISGEAEFLGDFEKIAAAGSMENVARFALMMEMVAVENYETLAKSASGDLKSALLDLAKFEKDHVYRLEGVVRDLKINMDDNPDEFHAQ